MANPRKPNRQSMKLRSLRFGKFELPHQYSGLSKIQNDALLLLQEGKSGTKPKPEAYQLARKTISNLVVEDGKTDFGIGEKVLFVLSVSLSVRYLSGYATLDSNHISNIADLLENIQRYVDDTSQKRPLNFLMLASPGAGKSHFIKCIAKRLSPYKIGAITFNMAGLQENEDLVPALDQARNLKVEDRIPLLFLDEFDSDPKHIPFLLPLLWDGEMNLGQRDLKLGKVIIVLAGSNPTLPDAMERAKSMQQQAAGPEGDSPKIIDLFSRINGGVIEISSFHDPARSIDRRTDKVCVAIQLLRQRFGITIKSAPLALLRFIAHTEFRYGVRSIAHLIDLIPYKDKVTNLSLDDLKLPVKTVERLRESSLAYHLLHKDQVHGVVKLWEKSAASNIAMPLFTDATQFFPFLDKQTIKLALASIADDLPR